MRIGMFIVLFFAAGRVPATTFGPADRPQPLVVTIRDFALVPRAQMDRAVAEAASIFERSDVSAVFRVERRSLAKTPGGPAGALAGTIWVHLYPPQVDRQIAEDPDVLGIVPGATSGGRLALVFPSRVEVLAKRHDVDGGMVLGAILAHEVGHILLPGRVHADSGVMRAFCDARQIHLSAMRQLAFTLEEATIIRRVMTSRS